MEKEVTFTMREMKRYGVIQVLLEKKMTAGEAASALNVSTRHIKRIKKKVQQCGALGVLHDNKGRSPAHAFPSEFRLRVIERSKLGTMNSTFPTSRRSWLSARQSVSIERLFGAGFVPWLGFGGKAHRVRTHRKRRRRSSKEGQMLFLDGSPHRSFGPQASCLILCTDDATGKPLYGLFREKEDLAGCFAVCQEVFQHYGLPISFYLDRASQFTTTRHGGFHVAQCDDKPTRFERAMDELGIRLIFADSPQARGRAERINGSFQDRLAAELRLNGITSIREATR